MSGFNYGYKQEFLAIKYEYDTNCATQYADDNSLNDAIASLDNKIREYNNSDILSRNTKRAELEATLNNGLGDHYSKLVSIRKKLNTFLDKASDKVADSQDVLMEEERYENRVNPQESMKPRELVLGIFSELRPSSVPYLLAAGVFMACISLLIIFQMFGFTGQINTPPAMYEAYGKMFSNMNSGPIYENPMVLSGLVILLGAGVIALAIMYFKAKQTPK
jgi:hypothetical protein